MTKNFVQKFEFTSPRVLRALSLVKYCVFVVVVWLLLVAILGTLWGLQFPILGGFAGAMDIALTLIGGWTLYRLVASKLRESGPEIQEEAPVTAEPPGEEVAKAIPETVDVQGPP